MAVNMKLADVGQREPRQGIIDQLGVHLELAKKPAHASVLDDFGWGRADTKKMEEVKEKLESVIAEQAESRDEGRLATVRETSELSNGKKVKRTIDRALRRYFRRAEAPPVTKDAFAVGGEIGASPAKLVAWFLKVREPLAKIAKELKPYLGGRDPVKLVDDARTALGGASSTQVVKLQGLPAETLEVYEAKGEAMLLIQDFIDAGREAYDGQAEIAALFNKDLIIAARRQRPKKVDPT